MPHTSVLAHRSYRWPFISAAVLVGALASSGTLFAQGFMSSGNSLVASSSSPGDSSRSNYSNLSSSNTTSSRKKESDLMPGLRIRAGVHDGILTVDGLVAKVGMNYPIDNSFLYFYIPGVGTAIVSDAKFPNAALQQGAFSGSSLKIKMGSHDVELTNGGQLLKDHNKSEAWVAVDTHFVSGERMPMMGFGNTLSAPYQWPGSKALTTQSTKDAPPVPTSLRPKMESNSSYSVVVGPVDGTLSR